MLKQLPSGFQARFFRETEGDTLPAIRTNSAMLFVPCFVREVQREDGTIGYKWFDAIIVPTGVDTSDYDTFVQKSWSFLRQYFYGTPEAQNEMRDDSTWEAHRQGIRSAFPKYEGEINTAAARFKDIYDAFWAVADGVLATKHLTRDDLPAQPFNAEQMAAWAVQKEISADVIQEATDKIAVISLDLLHNGRNWKELFNG